VRKLNSQGQMRYFGPSLDGFDGTANGIGYRSPGSYHRALMRWRAHQRARDHAELEEGLDAALDYDGWRTGQ
jgi:hypothetical protein